MRIWPGYFLRSALAMSLTVGIIGPTAARAGSVTTTTISAPVYSGSVKGPATGTTLPTGVQAGFGLSGGFAYDPSQLGSSMVGTGKETYVFTAPSSIHQGLHFNVTGTTFGDAYTNGAFTITITDLTGGGATLDIHAITAVQKTVNGVTGNAFIDLLFTAAKYSGTALPSTTTSLALFNLSAGVLTWDPMTPSGPEGLTGTVSVDLTQLGGPGGALPEPSGLVLATIAVTTGSAGFFFSRRKRAAA